MFYYLGSNLKVYTFNNESLLNNKIDVEKEIKNEIKSKLNYNNIS